MNRLITLIPASILIIYPSASAETPTVKVIAIANGDTVMTDKIQHKIRLAGIDVAGRKKIL